MWIISKKVNDTYGHQVGDDVLIKIAEILQKSIRGTDYAGRWGGEEFLVVAVQINLDDACSLANKIRENIASTDFEVVGRVTISAGVTNYLYGETVAHFVKRADDALYAAKEGGRNKVVCAENEV